MNDIVNVDAIVVTYNRSVLLKECLDAIFEQSYPVQTVYVIDNQSVDNTTSVVGEYIKNQKHIKYIKLEKNIGGAGGFNQGLKKASLGNSDYYWLMDDDTIPDNKALENMIIKLEPEVKKDLGFLCSNVFWTDGNPCIMNIPSPDFCWNKYASNNLIKLRSTSFVSVLLKSEVVKEVGLPISDFFIWGDDQEYTQRICKKYSGFMATDSIVTHKMKYNIGVNIINETNERLDRYFYEYRNRFYLKKSQKHGKLAYYKKTISTILKLIAKSDKNKWRKINIIIKGTLAGIYFKPQIEYLRN